MESLRKYRRYISFFIGLGFLIFIAQLWNLLSYVPLYERAIYFIIVCIVLIILGQYIEKKLDGLLAEEETLDDASVLEINDLKEQYDVFICYYTGGGERYASHIWKKLQDNKFIPFLSTMNINKQVTNDSEEYRDIIDEAILRSKFIVLIMTFGFSTRPEIIRELDLARKKNVTRLFYKHHKLPHSELKIKLSDEVLDISRGEYTSFENESDLFNDLCLELSGEDYVKDAKNITPEREVMRKILRPIYNDVDIVVRDIYALYRHNFDIWNEIGKKERYLWSMYDNNIIKSKIEEFYRILMKRNENLSYYQGRINRIINLNCMELLEEKELKYKSDLNNVILNTKVNFIYRNGNPGSGRSLLFQDVLLEGLGESIKLDPNIESYSVTSVFLNLAGGKPYEPTAGEFRQLWDLILDEASKDETIVFLRESPAQLISLGAEIIQLIEEV